MLDKTKEIKDFLKSLEDADTARSLMNDRIGSEIHSAIRDYSKSINDARGKTSLDFESVINCSICIGYLLKSHMDRVELNEMLEG